MGEPVMVALVVWPSTGLMVRRFGRALCLRSPARQSLRKRLEPARTVPDGPVAALMIPATLNRRAAHTGVAEDAQKAPEPAVAPELSGVIFNLMAPDTEPRKSTDDLRRIAIARAAEWARARGWAGSGSSPSQPG